MVSHISSTDEYDVTHFVSYPSPERGPERLWWMARARGMSVPVPSKARVLEVGCSTGDHLIALAEMWPGMECVGIDASSDQIAGARKVTEKVNIPNVRFVAGRIQDEKDALGTFDYIICHGVYSWIPKSEKAELLSALTECLSKNGILYLSHNTMPGWGTRGALCQLLKGADARELSNEKRVEMARELLVSADERLVDAFRPYGLQLQEEVKRNLTRSDPFFIHELLSPYTHAEWLSDVLREAKEGGLQYLGDAHPQRAHAFDPERDAFASPLPERISTPEKAAQFYDILFPASFRGSLFVNDSHSLENEFQSDALRDCFLSSPLVCENSNEAELTQFSMVPFYGPSEEVVEPKDPLLKLLLHRLSSLWPASEPLEELLQYVSSAATIASGEEEVLFNELLKLAHRNLLEVFPEKRPIATRMPSKPKVLPFRRYRAEQDWTITLRGELFKTDPLDRALIPLLDGSMNIGQCVGKVVELVRDKKLHLSVDEEEIESDCSELQDTVTTAIGEKFRIFLEQGMFFDDENSVI